jgi:hypothetical protein
VVHGEAYLLHVAAPVGRREQLLGLAARQGQLWQLKKGHIIKTKQQNTYFYSCDFKLLVANSSW